MQFSLSADELIIKLKENPAIMRETFEIYYNINSEPPKIVFVVVAG